MPTFDLRPGLRPLYAPENLEALDEWIQFATSLDTTRLLDYSVRPPDSEGDDGVVYEVATPAGLPGDFVVVDMQKVSVDTPHLHTNGEIEVHIPLLGSAKISLGRFVVKDLSRGDYEPVAPEEPHFLIPGDNYITGILSLPNYNPENQHIVNPSRRTVNFNFPLYLSVSEAK